MESGRVVTGANDGSLVLLGEGEEGWGVRQVRRREQYPPPLPEGGDGEGGGDPPGQRRLPPRPGHQV